MLKKIYFLTDTYVVVLFMFIYSVRDPFHSDADPFHGKTDSVPDPSKNRKKNTFDINFFS